MSYESTNNNNRIPQGMMMSDYYNGPPSQNQVPNRYQTYPTPSSHQTSTTDLMSVFNDPQNGHMAMTMRPPSHPGSNQQQLYATYSQRQPGHMYDRNDASQYSHYPIDHPTMYNSQSSALNINMSRLSYPNDMNTSLGNVTSHPQISPKYSNSRQPFYPSYSNRSDGSIPLPSTWPPRVSNNALDSDSHPSNTANLYPSSLNNNNNPNSFIDPQYSNHTYPSIQDDNRNSSKIQSNIPKSPSCTSMSSYVPDDMDSSNSSFSDSLSTVNEKTPQKRKLKSTNRQKTSVEVFNKLREMGDEEGRPIFVDRLEKLWEEHHILCRKLPCISRQTIDLYRLYVYIREQNGFEQFSKIAKNRDWRDIVSKLNIPNSSMAAFNIKQKYINLKLFHFECKYDRGGIDPEPILAEIEKQKEKRCIKNSDDKLVQLLHESSSTGPIDIDRPSPLPSNLISAPPVPSTSYQSQQVPAPTIHPTSIPISFPSNSVESTTIPTKIKRKKLTAKDVPPTDPMKLLMSLRGGLLAETTWALDTINIMLTDDQTHTNFHLKEIPGLLQAIIDIYIKCLTELFDEFKIENKQFLNDTINTPEQDSIIYRIESNYLNRYNKQQDITYEHVYDNQGNIKDNPQDVLDLQNMNDLCFIQTHFDPLHINDNYYENLFYGYHHSDDSLSSDEHDQQPIISSHKPIKTHKIDNLQNSDLSLKISDSNKQFRQLYQRKFQSDLDFCPNQQENSSSLFTRYSFGYDQICSRCICVSSILRNLSFISDNDIEFVQCKTLIHLLARLLLLKHSFNHTNTNNSLSDNDQTINDYQLKNEKQNTTSSFSWSECLINIRENTLVTLANISSVLIFDKFDSDLINQLIDGLLHWSTCYSDEAMDPLQSSYLSAQRLSIEILTKLSVHEMNIDFILATPPFYRITSLLQILTDWLNVDNMNNSISNSYINLTRSQTYIQREFAIVLLNALIRCDSNASNIIAHIPNTILLLIIFLEDYEIKTNEFIKRYGSDYILRLINTQQGDEILFTTNDMLKRAANCLLSIVNYTNNIKIMKKYEDRILNLSISNIIEPNIRGILTDILHYCSLYSS